jgi:preprotein translocase subunit SecG
MSKVDFYNLNYEQFEVDVNNSMKESRKAKKAQISRNKYLKKRLILLTTTFFICCIIAMIMYIKKISQYNKLERKVMDYIFFPYHSDLIPTLVILKKLKNLIKQITLEKTGKE